MQKLLMPFKKQMMLCGSKNASYLKHWGYPHYGVDISSIQGGAGTDAKIYASGDGEVIASGWDNSGGNVLVVLYPECLNHKTGEVYDLIARYMHLDSIKVVKGQRVAVGNILGVEGKTKTADYHLHLEFDTDTKYALYSPQVSSWDDGKSQAQGNILMKGTDSCIDPSLILHIGVDQVIVEPTYNPSWLDPEDFVIPKIEMPVEVVDWEDKYKLLKKEALVLCGKIESEEI